MFKSIRIDRKNNSTKSFLVLLFYRILNRIYPKKILRPVFWLIRFIQSILFCFLNISAQISYKATLGEGIRLPHSGFGVIISKEAVIGDNVTIFHLVTIGVNENKPEKRIIIGDNCYLSTGCKIISCELGKGCRVGPNAVVYYNLPNDTLYVSSNQIVKKGA